MSILDVREIMDRIPHRYPFLLVDRVIEVVPQRRIVAIKNVTINEPFFRGHFPGAPVMPGVLIIEALAQAGAVLLLNDVPERASKLVYFTGIDQARFRRPVVPGDQIRLTMEVLKLRSKTCKMRGIAEVDGALAAVRECCECEGILPAIESAHALAGARRWAKEHAGKRVLIGLSGRGDKDMLTLTQMLLAQPPAGAA
jgi:beta-hydroxyacyl-ACP dehydratase FabZ